MHKHVLLFALIGAAVAIGFAGRDRAAGGREYVIRTSRTGPFSALEAERVPVQNQLLEISAEHAHAHANAHASKHKDKAKSRHVRHHVISKKKKKQQQQKKVRRAAAGKAAAHKGEEAAKISQLQEHVPVHKSLLQQKGHGKHKRKPQNHKKKQNKKKHHAQTRTTTTNDAELLQNKEEQEAEEGGHPHHGPHNKMVYSHLHLTYLSFALIIMGVCVFGMVTGCLICCSRGNRRKMGSDRYQNLYG